MSRFCPGVFTNNTPSNTILVTFSTSCFWVCWFTDHADLSNLHQAIPYTTEVKGSAELCNVPRKCQVHVCAHVPCFLNIAEATQFSRLWHFQVFLPAPSSSCLFLPTTASLALVERSYVPSFSVCGVLLLI